MPVRPILPASDPRPRARSTAVARAESPAKHPTLRGALREVAART